MTEYAYWHKQTTDKPLYPDLLWSRPENRTFAGKLLIMGGNQYGFAAPAAAYEYARAAGIGESRVLLPDALKHTVGNVLGAGDFAPSTPSGSFSQKALDELLLQATWADGVLVAGDLGRNSETAILMEKFVTAHSGLLTLTKDAADYVIASPHVLLPRPDTTLVVSLAQLQKLAIRARYPRAFTFGMDLVRLVEALHEFSIRYPVNIVVKQLDAMLVAVDGKVSTTKLALPMETWRVKTAAYADVWWLQNTSRTFEALTTSLLQIQ